jgi:HAMP domain-containing protein
VCSTDDVALRRVAEAIDRLEADRRNVDAADLEARIAAVWSMVSEIDPELARLASGYETRAD